MTRSLLRSAILLALLVAPAAAENELALRASSLYTSDAGLYTTGGSNALVQAEVGFAHALRAIGRGQLWAEISYLGGERHADALGFETSLLVQQLTVGVRYTLPIRSWLVPHLRLGGGGVLGSFKLRDATVGDVSSLAGAATGYALAGITVLVSRGWMREHIANGFTVGIVAEGGAVVSSNLTFALTPSSPSDLSVPASGVTLGSIALTGPLFRIGAVVRF
jgi:hypothetical protein